MPHSQPQAVPALSKDGLLLIDKPAGITSHDVVDRLRRLSSIRRIGHSGTLDPFATGLLILGVGAATKKLTALVGLDKEYAGTVVLGATSSTQDLTSMIMPVADAPIPSVDAIESALKKFRGAIRQVPPMFSAKKVGGKKLYELARAGKEVERMPVDLVIHELEATQYDFPRLTIRVRCSSGTYIRTLAHDIGAALGTGAYLETLRRTKVGEFRVENAATLESLTKENWQEKLIK